MQTIRYKYIVWLLAALLFGSGCRRDLYYETEPIIPDEAKASVLITFDWAKSGLTLEKIKRASALIYPEDGGKPIESILIQDLTSTTVSLPVGKYRVVGFNETIAAADWQGMDFSLHHSFDSLTASIRLRDAAFGTKADEVIVGSGDHLAVAYSERFEVKQEMVGQTDKEKLLTIPLIPEQVTQPIVVKVKIQNLDNARSISATLSGMYASRKLTSGEYSDLRATHTFSMIDRTYDPTNPHNGIVDTRFYVFKLADLDIPRKLSLKIEQLDGKMYEAEFDVTSKIVLGELIYEVEVGYTEQDPVILPPISSEYLPVTINLDWSQSNMLLNQVKNASVWIYPSSGPAIELLLETNKQSVTTNLLAGSYAVVAFNERKGSSVWRGFDVFQESAYGTILAKMATPQNITAADVAQFVGANAETFEVKGGAVNQLTLMLTPITKVLEVNAEVENLDNVRSVSCSLTGMSGGAYICSRADLDTPATYNFTMSTRAYSVADKRNGTISTRFYVFGTPSVKSARSLAMELTLLDLTKQNELFDVSGSITATATGYSLTVGGIVVPARPRLPIEGDPSIDPWNPEENKPLL